MHKEIYFHKDNRTNLHMIQIMIPDYSFLFSQWDSSPLQYRMLNPELLNYILKCNSFIPYRNRRGLFIYLPSSSKNTNLEEKVKFAIYSHFSSLIRSIQKNIIQTFFLFVFYTLIGITCFLSVHILFSPSSQNILKNILIIGAWVFIWPAIEHLSFIPFKHIKKYYIYKRLRKIPIIFRYNS